MQTAICFSIMHFFYMACYIAENRLYTKLYIMLYSMVYSLGGSLDRSMRCYIADFRLYSMICSRFRGPWVVTMPFFGLYSPCFVYIPPSIAKNGGMYLKEEGMLQRRYIAWLVHITYLSPAGWDWLVAKARRHQRSQHPCHWVWTG